MQEVKKQNICMLYGSKLSKDGFSGADIFCNCDNKIVLFVGALN